MNDYLKFLMGNAESNNDVYSKYRCYCKILHEYHDFLWYDEHQSPHIIEDCDAFVEYKGSNDSSESDSEIQIHGKKVSQVHNTSQKSAQHKDSRY